MIWFWFFGFWFFQILKGASPSFVAKAATRARGYVEEYDVGEPTAMFDTRTHRISARVSVVCRFESGDQISDGGRHRGWGRKCPKLTRAAAAAATTSE